MVFGVTKLHLHAPTSIPGHPQFLTLESRHHFVPYAAMGRTHGPAQ